MVRTHTRRKRWKGERETPKKGEGAGQDLLLPWECRSEGGVGGVGEVPGSLFVMANLDNVLAEITQSVVWYTMRVHSKGTSPGGRSHRLHGIQPLPVASQLYQWFGFVLPFSLHF